MNRILIVEDDEGIVKCLTRLLEREGYKVEVAKNKKEALSQVTEAYSLALIDLTLPDGSGYTVCTALKQQGVPVIFLTADDEESSVMTGFCLGAEDYITKPFRAGELLCRMRAAIGRGKKESLILKFDKVEIDLGRGSVKKQGEEISLTALEYRLLLLLTRHPGEVLTRDQILDEIWDASGEYVNDNTLTVYMKRLREKLEENPAKPRLIQTVRGIGYRIGEADETTL